MLDICYWLQMFMTLLNSALSLRDENVSGVLRKPGISASLLVLKNENAENTWGIMPL